MDVLTGQHLLKKDGDIVVADEALSDKSLICFFFGAHWCPPCRNFASILDDFYAQVRPKYPTIEVIFVSFDKTFEQMMAFMNESHGDWLAVQHGSKLEKYLKKRFYVTSIPTLMVVARDGTVIAHNGRNEISERGPNVVETWLNELKYENHF